jgi:hypothetical protein
MACSRRPVTLEMNRRGPETPAVSNVSAVSHAHRAAWICALRVVVLVVHGSEFVTDFYRSKSWFNPSHVRGCVVAMKLARRLANRSGLSSWG